MARWPWRRRPDPDPPARDLNDPNVHMPGTFIDSWFNMPGGQPDDDRGPTMSELKGWTPPARVDSTDGGDAS